MPAAGIPNKILTQVCIIVRDCEATAARFRDILGFNLPTEFQVTLLHDHTRATYYGQPTDARAKLIAVDMNNLQFELLEPLDAPSEWKDYLDRHGEGIHHVAFFVPKTEPAAQSLQDYGYVITQQGLFTGQTGMYTYLDTDKDLGVVVELLEHFGGSPVIDTPPMPADRGLGTDRIMQVGIIVRDIDQTVRRFAEVLGIEPYSRQETLGYDVTQTVYNGQPSDARAKLAFFNTGQVHIELIEPDEQPSVWRDYLDRHGEGAQHIAMVVPNTQRATDYLAGFGITVAQQGLYSDRSGMYTYMDTDAQLGTTLELLENFGK